MAAIMVCGVCFVPQLFAQQTDYNFKRETTPNHLNRYSTTIYMLEGNKVFNLSGPAICHTKDSLVNLAVNPAGLDFFILSRNNKGTKASVFSAKELETELTKFSTKKYGTPAAAAYSSDARQLMVATETGLHFFDTKKFNHIKTLPLDFVPNKMITSTDGYYLVCADPHNVVVYNFEEFKPRKNWKFDENVTAVSFDEENKQFGILTDDGILSVYDTRNFGLKHTVEDLGEGLDFAFNFDGKYIAAVVSPEKIAIVNVLKDSEREFFDVEGGKMSEILFIPDCNRNPLLAFNRLNSINIKRMNSLAPYYGKLIADEVASRMNEWLKMAPGESIEQYRERVNDLTRARQQRLFEDEISTQFANNLLSTSAVTLGKYDRGSQMLEVDFDNMPSIFLPVPEADLADFNSADDLEFYDAKYGIMPDDNFELIYAKIRHKGTGKSYVYDNLDRKPLNFFTDEDNIVSIAVIQQQQLEEMKLQELRRQIVEEAKSQDVISDHTNITVDSRVEPSYDSNGKKILNYVISFAYEVEPGFSAEEDFGPGKYHVEESGAASAMLKIIKEAFDGDFAQYIKEGKKVNVKISGAADATPILRGIKYDGVYGDFDNEIVFQNGQMTGLSVNEKDGITENEQLAFLRAYGVRDFITKNLPNLGKMNSDYQYHITVSEDKGSEFRRITTEFTLVDIY